MFKTKKFFQSLIIFSILILMSGCSTLTYVGDDYQADNYQTVKTNEDFMFDVYKKNYGLINCRVGISKTSIPEILALYIQIENLSYETPYTFKVEDLQVNTPNKALQFITSANYLSIYQNQEMNSMSAMSSIAPTVQNMTGMMTNYNEVNQSAIQQAAMETNDGAFSKMKEIGDGISKHSIKYSSVISPRKSQYYYFFFENPQETSISVRYKNFNYSFKM